MAGFEHMGLGALAKRFAPQVTLIWLLLATELIDILWGIFWATGLESWQTPAYWSHSLFMVLVWSVLAGVIAARVWRGVRPGLVIGLLVFSHWVVDFITHPMGAIIKGDTGVPVFPGNPTLIGLGLYMTMPGIIIGFLALVAPGLVFYLLYRRRKSASGMRAR
jgi:hypothetical protein